MGEPWYEGKEYEDHPMPKPKSRSARWYAALAEARSAFDTLDAAWAELVAVQGEYQEWRDNLPENLAQSALGENLDAMTELGLEDALSEIESVLDDAENTAVPQGFGRD